MYSFDISHSTDKLRKLRCIAWLDALCESQADLTCRNYRLEGKLLTASTAVLSASGDKIKCM
jgi:hypothetical protein